MYTYLGSANPQQAALSKEQLFGVRSPLPTPRLQRVQIESRVNVRVYVALRAILKS